MARRAKRLEIISVEIEEQSSGQPGPQPQYLPGGPRQGRSGGVCAEKALWGVPRSAKRPKTGLLEGYAMSKWKLNRQNVNRRMVR